MVIKTLFLVFFISVCWAKKAEKIFGGSKVEDIREYSFLASLQHQDNHVCSCSIISNYNLLTSASCSVLETVPLALPMNLKVLTGTTDRFGNTLTHKYHNVRYVFFHPFYNERNFWAYDVAILRLEKPLHLSLNRNTAYLATRNYFGPHVIKTAGWGGNTLPFYVCSRYLQVLDMNIEKIKDCQNFLYGSIMYPDVQNCATPLNRGSGVTLGDGGNPLFHGREIVGIASVRIISEHNVIIYSQIFSLRDWINDIINNY